MKRQRPYKSVRREGRGEREGAPAEAPTNEVGSGNFRSSNPVIADQHPEVSLPLPRGPALLRLSTDAPVPANTGGGSPQTANPPPATQTRTHTIASSSTDVAEFDVSVAVLADVMNASSVAGGGARTDVTPERSLQRPQQARWQTRGGRVVAVTHKLVVRGRFTIRTSYATGASPRDRSLYGRGTTRDDVRNGDTTLGFHEWCHQQEFFEYLITTAFPELEAAVGDSIADFRAAMDQFSADYRQFMAGIGRLGAAVDEVGYTKSQCVADGACR